MLRICFMQQFARSQRYLAFSIAGLAGFVDATGFIQVGGYFISFMSGNTTRLAADIALGASRMLVPAGLILGFTGGVALGTWIGDRKPMRREILVLGLVTGLLLLAAGMRAASFNAASLGALVVGMGALNTALSANRKAGIGLTYMTGALVRMGQALAERFSGKDAHEPDRLAAYFLLWACLSMGALAGALVSVEMPGLALWAAATGSAIMLLAAWRMVSNSTN